VFDFKFRTTSRIIARDLKERRIGGFFDDDDDDVFFVSRTLKTFEKLSRRPINMIAETELIYKNTHLSEEGMCRGGRADISRADF